MDYGTVTVSNLVRLPIPNTADDDGTPTRQSSAAAMAHPVGHEGIRRLSQLRHRRGGRQQSCCTPSVGRYEVSELCFQPLCFIFLYTFTTYNKEHNIHIKPKSFKFKLLRNSCLTWYQSTRDLEFETFLILIGLFESS